MSYSDRWTNGGNLIRTQLQETGRVRLSFLTLADVYTACVDLGIDPLMVEFRRGYAVVKSSENTPDRQTRTVDAPWDKYD